MTKIEWYNIVRSTTLESNKSPGSLKPVRTGGGAISLRPRRHDRGQRMMPRAVGQGPLPDPVPVPQPLPQAGAAYPATPRAFLTASPIGTKGFSSGVVARNIRLWVMATASRVSGSAQPIDPPAPGWPKIRGFFPAATIDRGGAASPMLATRWNPPMLPLWGTPCT